jgi:hypothetical protein
MLKPWTWRIWSTCMHLKHKYGNMGDWIDNKMIKLTREFKCEKSYHIRMKHAHVIQLKLNEIWKKM